MWIMTTASFVSAVQLYNDPDRLMVRARDHESLRLFIESARAANPDTELTDASISRDDKADYRYRVIFTKQELAATVSYEILSFLTYHNFKEAATKVRGRDYHDALLNVWTAMRRLTTAEDGYSTPFVTGYHGFNEPTEEELFPDDAEEVDDDALYRSLADMTDEELNEWMLKNG
jgi:hypothetical protein